MNVELDIPFKACEKCRCFIPIVSYQDILCFDQVSERNVKIECEYSKQCRFLAKEVANESRSEIRENAR